LAGVALLAVFADVGELYGLAVVDGDVLTLPELFVEPDLAAVQMVGRVVGGELVFVSVDRERAVGDAVAVAADGRAHVAGVVDPAFECVVAEGDVLELALAVGGFHGDEGSAEVGQRGGQAVGIGEGVELGGPPVGQGAVGVLHDGSVRRAGGADRKSVV